MLVRAQLARFGHDPANHVPADLNRGAAEVTNLSTAQQLAGHAAPQTTAGYDRGPEAPAAGGGHAPRALCAAPARLSSAKAVAQLLGNSAESVQLDFRTFDARAPDVGPDREKTSGCSESASSCAILGLSHAGIRYRRGTFYMHPSTRPSRVSSRISSPPGWSITSWTSLLSCFADCFTRPSFAIFWKLIIAWVICPGRHTITRLYLLAEPDGSRAHDAYHRFFRVGAWSLEQLWRRLAIVLVEGLCPGGRLQLAVDDTIFRKWGSKVEGAGRYKDPVRSTGRDVVFVTGLNFVSLGLLVRPPWAGMPLSLPVCVRLYRKPGPNHIELAVAMIVEVTTWFPGRRFVVVADGAYSALARAKLPRTVIVSRTRKNAELYDPQLAQRPPGTRGRPRLRGDRLASPCQMAQNPDLPWRVFQVEVRGRQIERLIYARVVLWWFTCRGGAETARDRPRSLWSQRRRILVHDGFRCHAGGGVERLR